jgi:hypothetical protein
MVPLAHRKMIMKQNSYDYCMQLLQNARVMTKEFPPYVRGMGPNAEYWESAQGSKPSSDAIKKFIDLLDEARIEFLSALPKDIEKLNELLAGLKEIQELQGHISFHPGKERELRSAVRKINFQADQFGVPMKDRVSSIQSKIRLDINPSTTDVEYLIFKAEIKRIAQELLAVKKNFGGENIKSAFNNLFSVAQPNQILEVSVEKKKCNDNATTGVGNTKEEAIADAKSRIPIGSNITATKLVEPVNEGMEAVSAFAEKDARKMAAEKMPENATIKKIECIEPSRKGILGIGRRDGQWKVFWRQKAKVSVSFNSSVEIEARFVPGE